LGRSRPGGEGSCFWSVILRPVFGPKDLGLEAVENQRRGPSSLRSLGTTSKGKIEVLRVAQDDRGLSSRGRHLGRSRPGGEGSRFWSVILRPVFGPKDLALEVLQSQNRGPSRYSGRQTKAKSRPFALLRTTDKGKIEALRLAQDDRQKQNRGPSPCSGRQSRHEAVFQ
jgi:hypothetical protein